MDINEKINLGIQKYLNKEGSLTQIVKELNLESSKILSNKLKELGYYVVGGISVDVVINTKKAVDKYVQQYQKGENPSLTKIAKEFNIGRRGLTTRIKALNIPIINYQNKTKFNEHVFDIIDTEEKAYWLGFIFADGYISKRDNCFELSLSEKDTEQLKKFNAFMQYDGDNVKIQTAKYQNGETLRCRWSITNKHLWNTLNDYGCTPQKSLTVSFPEKNVFKDSSLIRHFIRGYFDGNGCISYANKEHTQMEMNITGCIYILNDIIQYLSEQNKITISSPIKKSNCSEYVQVFHVRGQKGLTILNNLYKDSTIYLNRKYEKYLEYCRLYE